jgi:hypothetical protein
MANRIMRIHTYLGPGSRRPPSLGELRLPQLAKAGKGSRVPAGWATEEKILLRTDVFLLEKGYALGSDHR